MVQKILAVKNWHVGLLTGIVLLGVAQLNGLHTLEEIMYDWTIRHVSHVDLDKVAVIAIDDKSLNQLGDWPWPRTLYTQMIDALTPYSLAIGFTLDFSRPQQLTAPLPLTQKTLSSLKKLTEKVRRLNTLLEQLNTVNTKERTQFLDLYKSADFMKVLDTVITESSTLPLQTDGDQQLALSFKNSGKIFLGMPLKAERSEPLPKYIVDHEIKTVTNDQRTGQSISTPSDLKIIPPIEKLTQQVAGLGVMIPDNTDPRRIPLVIKDDQHYFASLPLLMVAKSHKLSHTDVEVIHTQDMRIRMGSFYLKTDEELTIHPWFDPRAKPLTVDSFVDVLKGEIPAEKYQDKIVLLGVTTPRYGVMHSTPLGQKPTVIVLAHTVASLLKLNQKCLITPLWAPWLKAGLIVFLILYLGWILPYLRATVALIMSTLLLVSIGFTYTYSMKQGWFIAMALPVTLILVGHFVQFIERSITTYRKVIRLQPKTVETNRLLGLAFQGQGLLDLAFEKFCLCPGDAVTLGLLYNLALDYESKQQFKMAGTIYHYILSQNPNFRDVEQRTERLHKLKKTGWFQEAHSNSNTLQEWLAENHAEKPMLGRYQIERQLGKGAMGTVFLGKDPRMNRFVAIKTLALAQEFETDELPEVTVRFFREASAAGRLTHPYIISTFDAGEEHDLAYIAMEFFKGGNLVPYTQSDNLLPVATIIKIVMNVAEALDYACRQGVIHRDIKPANIMYNPATGKIKITDFGIAKITDSTRTRTGIFLGTPSYMSPEQLAGKNLDGRTDLFSLGVTLFQLLTGILPFHADSMATLMFKIANEPHQNVLELRANLPPCLKQIVDRALQKDPTERYQTGLQFAQALYDCGYQLGEPFVQALRENNNDLRRMLICS